MAAGTLILLKRKAGAFTGGQLAAGEVGIDTTNAVLYFSTDGSTVETVGSGGNGGSGGAGGYVAQAFTAQASVTVTHNFARYPVVDIIDSDGELVIPQTIDHTSTSAFTVTFSASTTGTIIAAAPGDLKVGTTPNLPLKTGTDGVVEAGAFGTGSGEFAQGNDSRFSKDLVIVTDATAAVTLDSSNCYPDYIRCTSGSAVTLTLAAGQSAAVGRHWIIRQAAAGVATVSANDSTPAAITRNGDPSTAGQHTEIAVILVADGVVDIVGGVA